MPGLWRVWHGEEEVTAAPAPAEPDPPERVERMVSLLSLRCAVCRAAAKAARLHGKGGWSPSGPRPDGCRCRRVWAPGYGPGSEPPPAPGTPEDRRAGPV